MELHDFSILLEEEPKNLTLEKVASKRFRLKRCDLKLFAASLARLLAGGIPILRALEAMEKSTQRPQFKRFLHHLSEGIKQGKSFKEALEATNATPVFFSQMIY